MASELWKCPPRATPTYLVKSRCGQDRDCLNDDRLVVYNLAGIVCNAIAWVNKTKSGWVEIFTQDGSRRVAKVTSRWVTELRIEKCGFGGKIRPPVGAYAPVDGFTVDVPGLQDIIKVKDWDSPTLRFERFKRFESARSAVPTALQWIPPLLTKLDNAQDMIFTGLALAIPIIRRLGPRLIPGIGILLTLNDVLNLFT